MAEKQLIVAVEGTAAMGPYWHIVVSDYLDKIIRCFCSSELTGQKNSTSNVEFSLVTFNTHGSYCACLVQRSGWTKDVDIFLQWLSAIPFSGGGFNDAAIAEGLSEALMMFPIASNGNQTPQNVDGQRHCILVAASNPYPLPTPVYRPQIQNLEQVEHSEAQTESRLSDAETVARSFAQCSVSLSVICPKQLAKLKAIYSAGKRNPRAADPPVDNVKNSQFLVLISENFMEGRAAFSRSGVPSLATNQSPVKMDMASVTSVTGPPPSSGGLCRILNGSMVGRPPVSIGNVATATVKVEPTTITSMATGPAFSHVPSVPRAPSQAIPTLQTSSPLTNTQEGMTSGDNMQELKPSVSGMTQPSRTVPPAAANVNILNNLSQARVMSSAALTGGTSIGLQSMGQTPVAMHMSNMISSGMASSVPPAHTVLSSGQPTMTSLTGSGALTGTAQVPPNSGLSSFSSATSNVAGNSNIGISQSMGNVQGAVNIGQSVPGMSQGNHSGTQMMQSGVGMSQNMSALGQSTVSSGNGTMIPTPGMSQQVQSGMQTLGVSNSSAASMPLSQQTSSALQSAQSKYVKVWEEEELGNLSGQRQGQPVFITRLEGYRSASASETLAAHWPQTMQIVRLISQDHMNNKQYVGKADFLVFRAMNQHGFLGQLQEKKLCAVIQLPQQTLLLSVSDKACRLIGMLFPGQLSQQQQMVGSGMGPAYVQGPGRSQLVSQGQVSSQAPPNMPGGGFMS
ncbi:mediator of RNA polymerase II transcription subunit 25-like isoform X2 [Gossypium australe]|uniref:Mediator of RNA polymerase II transcription subunit 25 n=1 Tax=Gossypium australe TaxID=47621 RepID=A0A5B6X4W5_9ROSI|nr:mediator of RNA polymerase II transcription subunit 25-like isoform X2 [Gossypium australe]